MGVLPQARGAAPLASNLTAVGAARVGVQIGLAHALSRGNVDGLLKKQGVSDECRKAVNQLWARPGVDKGRLGWLVQSEALVSLTPALRLELLHALQAAPSASAMNDLFVLVGAPLSRGPLPDVERRLNENPYLGDESMVPMVRDSFVDQIERHPEQEPQLRRYMRDFETPFSRGDAALQSMALKALAGQVDLQIVNSILIAALTRHAPGSVTPSLLALAIELRGTPQQLTPLSARMLPEPAFLALNGADRAVVLHRLAELVGTTAGCEALTNLLQAWVRPPEPGDPTPAEEIQALIRRDPVRHLALTGVDIDPDKFAAVPYQFLPARPGPDGTSVDHPVRIDGREIIIRVPNAPTPTDLHLPSLEATALNLARLDRDIRDEFDVVSLHPTANPDDGDSRAAFHWKDFVSYASVHPERTGAARREVNLWSVPKPWTPELLIFLLTHEGEHLILMRETPEQAEARRAAARKDLYSVSEYATVNDYERDADLGTRQRLKLKQGLPITELPASYAALPPIHAAP